MDAFLPPYSNPPTAWEYFRNTLIASSVIILPPSLLATLVAFAIYSLIPGSNIIGETLCRRCGYPLKGLSKPECPECGEVI
jgi:hypothetical protein